MNFKALLVINVLLLLCYSSNGAEYFLGFIPHYSASPSLIMTTTESTPVYYHIEAPGIDFCRNGTIIPNTQNIVNLPVNLTGRSHTFPDSIRDKIPKGIHIKTSSDKVTVIGQSNAQDTIDTFLAVPLRKLCLSEYVYYPFSVATQAKADGSIAIVGTEDATKVTITIPVNAKVSKSSTAGWKKQRSGTKRTYKINKLQIVYVSAYSKDLSGTKIVADKPLSVISGHECAFVPRNTIACDHLVEQVLPTALWGTKYYVAPLASRKSYTLKIIAAYKNTKLQLICNGTQRNFRIDEGKIFQRVYGNQEFCAIHSNRKLSVVQLSHGNKEDNTGDPMMTLIPAVNDFSSKIVFSTNHIISHPYYAQFINIIVMAEYFQPRQIYMKSGRIDETLESYNWVPITVDSNIKAYAAQVYLEATDKIFQITHFNSSALMSAIIYGFIFDLYKQVVGGYGHPARLSTFKKISNNNDRCTARDYQIFSASDFLCNCTNESDCIPEVDNCSPNPCQNNGTCVDDGVNFSCICVAGYTDEKCGTNIDNCLSNNNPCQNNGTCVDLLLDYACICLEGYTDKNCSTKLHCSPNPCQNNGICTDTTTGYICTCIAGFTGDMCSNVIDNVTVNFCNNNATTINFEKSLYSSDEGERTVHPVLILSNPLTKDITIKVLTTNESDEGDYDYSSGSSGSLDLDQNLVRPDDVFDAGGYEDYDSGPYFVKIIAGRRNLTFNVSIIDDDKWEQSEIFYLTIDESSLPCNVTVGDQHKSAVTILDNDGYSSNGAEYFLAFLPHFSGSPFLIMTTTESTPVYYQIEVPGIDLFRKGTIIPNTQNVVWLTVKLIGRSHEFRHRVHNKAPKGIYLKTSSDKVTIIGQSNAWYSLDTFLAVPLRKLCLSEYVYYPFSVASYSAFRVRPDGSIAIVGIEDGTKVTITVLVNTKVSKSSTSGWKKQNSGTKRTYIINKLQTIYVSVHLKDLTGTKIVADKPLSVISGHQCARVPNYAYNCDHLAEQVLPTALWGTKYYVAPLASRRSYTLKIIAAYNNTILQLVCNGTQRNFKIDEGKILQQAYRNLYCAIHSNKKISVVQLSHVNEEDNAGGPMMTLVPAVNDFSSKIVSSTTQDIRYPKYVQFINIIVMSEYFQPSQIYLKTSSINKSLESYNWEPITVDNTTEAYAAQVYLKATDEVFQINHFNTSALMSAIIYGFFIDPHNQYRNGGYGHPAGLNFAKRILATTINFEKPSYSINEDGRAIQPVLTLSNPLTKDITVKVLTTDGSAEEDDDYSSGSSGSLDQNLLRPDVYNIGGDEDYVSGPYFVKLTAGMTHFQFNVSIIDDDKQEETEYLFLTIDESSLPCDVKVGNQYKSTVTILDDDGCTITSGNIYHDCERKMTMLVFQGVSKYALQTLYTCKLDEGEFKICTSPMLWNDLKNGSHAVTVKASCIIEGVQYSSKDLKIQFQID